MLSYQVLSRDWVPYFDPAAAVLAGVTAIEPLGTACDGTDGPVGPGCAGGR